MKKGLYTLFFFNFLLAFAIPFMGVAQTSVPQIEWAMAPVELPFEYKWEVGNTPPGSNCFCTLLLQSTTSVSCKGASTGGASVLGNKNGTDCTSTGSDPDDNNYSWNSSPVQNSKTLSNVPAGVYICTWQDPDFDCPVKTRTVTITEPSQALTASLTFTNPTCGQSNGDVAVSFVGGGTGAYTYSWKKNGNPYAGNVTSISNLSPATYACTVTDANGCTFVASQPLTNQGTAVNITGTSAGQSCFGVNTGTASVTFSGGSGHTFLWTPGGKTTQSVNNMAPNTYTVTVTSSAGCSDQATVSITSYSQITSSGFSSGWETCGNGQGSATINPVGGGAGGYTYNWTNGATGPTASNLSQGNYSVTVTDDAGCTRIFGPATIGNSVITLTGNTNVISNVSCKFGSDGQASVTATNGTPNHTYFWTAPINQYGSTMGGLAVGTYNINMTDANGCTGTANVTITEPSQSVGSNATKVQDANCGTATGSATANPSGGVGTYTYLWSPSGGAGINAVNLSAGTYSVTVWDANGCSDVSSCVIGTTGNINGTANMVSPVTCNGGTNGVANVVMTSGTPPYTYLWAPSGGASSAASGLAAGNYNVTVTDNAGCVTIEPVTVTQPTAITASMTMTPANCATANGTAKASPAGGTGNFTYSWGTTPVQTTQTASNLTNGIYSVVVRDANNCSKTFSVTVGTVPSPAIAFSTTSVTCNGGTNGSASATPTGGGGPPYTYVWNTGASSSAISGVAGGTYTVTVSTGSCTNTSSVTVAQPAAIATIITTTPTPCLQSVGSANVAASGGSAPFTYSWSTSPVQTGATATGLTAGFYSVTVTDKNGCSKNASGVVNNTNGPSLTMTSGASSCFGSNDGSATMVVSSGTQPYTYAWAPSGGTTSVATGLSPQVYSGTVTDAVGCVTTSTVLVTSPTAVLPNVITPTFTICKGGQAQLNINPSGGTPGYTYNWIPAADLDDGTLQNPVAGPTTSTVYTVTVEDKNGCQGFGTVSVTVNNPPPINAGAPSITICNGGTASLNATGGVSYSWSPATALNNTTIANPVSTPASPISYIVVGTDAKGCTNSDTVSIGLVATPTVNVSASATSICSGTNVTLTAATNAVSYSWSSGQTTSSATVVPQGNITYTVVVSTGNCSTSKTIAINASPTPTATINGSSVLCIGKTQTLSAPAGNYSYQWSTGSTASAIVISPTLNTTYSLTVTSNSNNTCLDTAMKTVTIAQNPVVTTSATYTTICAGSAINTLTATGGATYLWSPGGGTTSSIAVSFPIPGIKNYTVLVTNSSGCTSTGSLSITATTGFAIPVVVPNTPLSFCVGATLPTFTATPNPSTNAIGWSLGSTTVTATGTTFTPPANLGPGTYPLNCVQGTGTSCLSLPDVKTIVIHPLPNANAGNGTTVCPGYSAQLNGSGGITYAWSPSASISNPNISNPTAEPELTTTYVVTVTDANTCRKNDSVVVHVVLNDTCLVVIYNMISPNGDDDNDVWWIDGIRFFPENNVKIFNRWGQLVWEGDGYDNDKVVWKGDSKHGGNLPEATYFYIIDIGKKKFNGFVELVH